jgi:broad specificity phosphatase PhoE
VEIFLVRHGATTEFVSRRYGDNPLSDEGLAQADALADLLRETQFDLCLVSPLRRAQQTAERVTRGRGIPVETHACLAEGALGELDGLDHDEAARRFPAAFRLGRTLLARIQATGWTAPGGETRDAFIARARAAHSLVSGPLFHESRRALVVSHGGLLSILIQLLVGHEPRDGANIGLEFCGVVRFTAYHEPPDFGPFAMLRFVSA